MHIYIYMYRIISINIKNIYIYTLIHLYIYIYVTYTCIFISQVSLSLYIYICLVFAILRDAVSSHTCAVRSVYFGPWWPLLLGEPPRNGLHGCDINFDRWKRRLKRDNDVCWTNELTSFSGFHPQSNPANKQEHVRIPRGNRAY